MAVHGIAMVKDEVDIIEGVLRHMAGECDALIVADNGSTDGTRDVLSALVGELDLTVLDDPDPAYRQSEKMSRLGDMAAGMDRADPVTIIVPFDADELWVSRAGRLREVLPGLPWQVFRAPLYNHLRTALDLDDPDPFRSMVWRQRDPGALPKVAVRWQSGTVIEQGNHSVSLPEPGLFEVLTEPVVEIHHFPIRSAQHMITKARNGAAAYAAAPDLPADMGRHWRAWGQLSDDQLREAFDAHWWYGSPIDAGLIRDPAPYRRWETAP